MALTIIGNEVVLPGEAPADTEVKPPAYPLDEKILGGIALSGPLVPELLNELDERIALALEIMQQDRSREFGACLAYGIRLNKRTERKIDDRLVSTLSALGSQALAGQSRPRRREQLEHPSMYGVVWTGYPDKRILKLNKHTGPIVMSDGAIPEGTVYSLLSRTVTT